jgi:hypothetical protein
MSYDSSGGTHRVLPGRISVLFRRCCRRAFGRVRACTFWLAFWLAIGLPWLVLGSVLGGYATGHPFGFTALFGVTVLCGVVGRGHRR